MCRLIETPIIRDMRRTAAQLGIVDDLITIRRLGWGDLPEDARLRLDHALEVLGVDPPLFPPAASTPFDAPDPRD